MSRQDYAKYNHVMLQNSVQITEWVAYFINQNAIIIIFKKRFVGIAFNI